MMKIRGVRLKVWPAMGIGAVQLFLLFSHWFLYRMWIDFHPGISSGIQHQLWSATLVLAFSFAATTLSSFRFPNCLVPLLYTAASVWLGFLNYFFRAACLCWPAWFALQACGLGGDATHGRPVVASVLFGAALTVCVIGPVNARLIRVRRYSAVIENLPAPWHERRALGMSDLHLGAIRGKRCAQLLAVLAQKLEPEIVFVPGDLCDGTKHNLDRLPAPLKSIEAPPGIFFSTGNHEEFGNPKHYLEAAEQAGMRVLANESVAVEGVEVLGISYSDSTCPIRVREFLGRLGLDRSRPSIRLKHAPTRLPIVEQAGVSLHISGHTHGGQLFPFTWIACRVFGQFTHGLNHLGTLQVCTSTGAGTWGPPMRVGTSSEVAELTFL